MPAADTPADYPKITGVAQAPAAHPPLASVAAAPAPVTFDGAFPHITNRLLKNKLEVGVGSDLFGKNWLMGGGSGRYDGKVSKYCFFAECTVPFSNADELWASLDQGIVVQMSGGYPCITKTTYYRNDGSTHTAESVDHESIVIARAFPAAHDSATFPDEFQVDAMNGGMDTLFGPPSPHGEQLSAMERWAFNFQLPLDWQATQPNFSFATAFPKCTRWLTHNVPGQKAHWFRIKRGVIAAFNTKHSVKKEPEPFYETDDYDTIHEAWADMEAALVLPKAWGK